MAEGVGQGFFDGVEGQFPDFLARVETVHDVFDGQVLFDPGRGVVVLQEEWPFGSLGFNWGKPVFVCYVRQSRFTRELLDCNPEFTINMPVGDYDKHIIRICGGKSGRDIDKVKELGLTLVEGSKVIYRQEETTDYYQKRYVLLRARGTEM